MGESFPLDTKIQQGTLTLKAQAIQEGKA